MDRTGGYPVKHGAPRARPLLALVGCALAGAGIATRASAATLPCPNGTGDPSQLAQAIVTADVVQSPSTITLPHGCTFTLTAPDASAQAATIDGETIDLDDWWGPDALPAITAKITIDGNGAVLRRAAGAPPFRFFFIGADPSAAATLHWSTPGAGNLTLQDLTLSGGEALGGSSEDGGGGLGAGGAIYNQGQLTLERVTLSGNRAQGGSSGVTSDGDSGGGVGSSSTTIPADFPAPTTGAGGGFGGGFKPPGAAGVGYSLGNTDGGGAGLAVGEDGAGQAGGGGGTYGTGTGGTGGEDDASTATPCAPAHFAGCGGDGSGAGGYFGGSQDTSGATSAPAARRRPRK